MGYKTTMASDKDNSILSEIKPYRIYPNLIVDERTLIKCKHRKCPKLFRDQIFMTKHYSRFHKAKEEENHKENLCWNPFYQPHYNKPRSKTPPSSRLKDSSSNPPKKSSNIKAEFHMIPTFTTKKSTSSREHPLNKKVNPKVKKSEPQKECITCKKQFNSSSLLKQHEKQCQAATSSVIASKKFQCKMCSKVFASALSLDYHHQHGHTSKVKLQRSNTHLCTVCQGRFESAAVLKEHQKQHWDPSKHTVEPGIFSQFKCHICSKTYANTRFLELHIRGHKLGKNNKRKSQDQGMYAEIRNKKHKLLQKLTAIKHQEKSLSGLAPKRPTKCEDSKETRLLVPYVQPVEEGMFKCQTCNKVLGDAAAVKRHEKRNHAPIQHSHRQRSQEKLECSTCFKTFVDIVALKRHEKRNHTISTAPVVHRERKFKCDLCPRAFAQSNNLSRHVILVHKTEPKIHICYFCGKSFGFSFCLKRHMSIHTREGQFTCRPCKRSFYTQSLLSTHQKHHNLEVVSANRLLHPSVRKIDEDEAESSKSLTANTEIQEEGKAGGTRNVGKGGDSASSVKSDYSENSGAGSSSVDSAEGKDSGETKDEQVMIIQNSEEKLGNPPKRLSKYQPYLNISPCRINPVRLKNTPSVDGSAKRKRDEGENCINNNYREVKRSKTNKSVSTRSSGDKNNKYNIHSSHLEEANRADCVDWGSSSNVKSSRRSVGHHDGKSRVGKESRSKRDADDDDGDNGLKDDETPINKKSSVREEKVSSPQSCHLCKKECESADKLNEHMVTHLTEEMFQCKLCLKIFTQSDTLLIHSKLECEMSRKQLKILLKPCDKI